MVDFAAYSLFGSHIARSAHDGAHLRDRLAWLGAFNRGGRRRGLVHLGDPEVEDLDKFTAVFARLDQDVVGLQVAVHDAGCTSGGQSVGDLRRDRAGLAPGQRPARPQQRAQTVTAHELHNEVRAAVVQHPIVDCARHVGVLELGHGHRFAGETGRDLATVSELRSHHLDRNLLVQG